MEHLPVEALFNETVLSHGSVFHHFNKGARRVNGKKCG